MTSEDPMETLDVDPLWEEFREQIAEWCLDGRHGNITRMRSRMATFFDLHRVCIWCGSDLPKDRRRQWCADKFCGENASYRYDWDVKRRSLLWHENGMPVACALCGEHCAEEVHHIVPISDGGSPFDRDNLIGLCSSCHLEAHREINAKKDTKANRARIRKEEKRKEEEKALEEERRDREQKLRKQDEYWDQFGGITSSSP